MTEIEKLFRELSSFNHRAYVQIALPKEEGAGQWLACLDLDAARQGIGANLEEALRDAIAGRKEYLEERKNRR